MSQDLVFFLTLAASIVVCGMQWWFCRVMENDLDRLSQIRDEIWELWERCERLKGADAPDAG